MNTRPLRIAIVMPTFYEQCIGGSEYQCYLLAERAIAEGMQVHYIFIDNGQPCANKLNLELHRLKPIRTRKRFGATWSFYFRSVSRLLKEIRPDVVYVRGGWSFAAMTAAYAKKHGCTSIWHVASSADVIPQPLSSLLKRPFNVIERRAIDYAIHHSTHVVAHARFQADLLRKYYGRTATVILKEQPEPEGPLDKTSTYKVVWVANIKPLKQPEMFIRLAREFTEKRDVQFIMIGRPSRGKYQDGLDAGIRALPNITYMREQPIEEVNRILAQSHVFVNTSTYEGLPNTFVQSWMREVPVVSMLLDPDDILATQKIGYCSGSFEQMVRDVRRLVDNPGLRDDMGRRAREYALENHSLKKNMKRLLDLIVS